MIKVLQCRQRHLVASSFASQNCISWNVQSLPVLNLKFNRRPSGTQLQVDLKLSSFCCQLQLQCKPMLLG